MTLEKNTSLSEKEREVVEALLSQPTASNAELAKSLGKSEKTIENQLRSAYKRLGISGDRCQKGLR